MRPLGFSSNAFKKDTLDHAIDLLAMIGYGAVELMADLHHAYPTKLVGQRRRDLAKRLAGLGLVVSNVNAFTHFIDGDTYHPTWFEPDPRRTQQRIDHTNRCLELAAELGARTVSIQPGGPLMTSGLDVESAHERFAESLSQCLDTARACGVILAIEPEPGLLIESAGEYLGFKQRFFDSERLIKMNCDVGHLFCVGDDPAGVIRAMPDEVAHVHVEDIGANRVHQHLTPGRGVMDFQAIFDALDAIDFAGHTTVELYPYETTAAGVARAAFEHLAPIAQASREPGAWRFATASPFAAAVTPASRPPASQPAPAAPTDAFASGAPMDAFASGAPMDAFASGAPMDAFASGAPMDAFASGAKPIGHDDDDDE